MADLVLRVGVVTAGVCLIGASAYSLSANQIESSSPISKAGYPVRIELQEVRLNSEPGGAGAALPERANLVAQRLPADPVGIAPQSGQTDVTSPSSDRGFDGIELAEGVVLLDSAFSLPRTTANREVFKSRLRLVVDGQRSGWIDLIVGERNQIFVDKPQLSERFPRILVLFPSEKRRISFDELRAEGLTIQYNARMDEIHIS